ncbi:hypothetical protein FACS1894125_6700 [Actinomycetota bacterium]|nr:hypothetical protein FACS1894125_6700 [Actinomycetota bacterium]
MDLYNISDHAFATEHKFMTSYFPNYFSIILFDIFSPIASIAHISGPEAVTIAPALDALWGRTFGIWFLVVLLISILLWKYIDVKLKRTIAFYVSLCVITGILSSTLINWAQLPEKFSMLQFSYRFLEIGTFFICALVGPVVVVAIRKLPSKFDISIVKKATVILVISIGLLTTSWIPSNIKYLSITIGMDIRSLDNGTKAEGDMLPQDLFSTMFDYAKGAPPEEMEQLLKVSQSDGVTVEYMERNELSFFVDVISNDAQGTMTLPVIYYPGYKAYISDSGQSIWVRPDANGRVLVTIPPNFHGQIHVFFGMSNTTKLGVAISAFTAFTSLLLGIIWLLKRRNRKHRTLTPASS